MAKLKWVLLALVLGALIVWSLMPQPVAVELGQVTREHMDDQVVEDGYTRVVDRYAIYAPVDGQLLRIPHKPGTKIVAGETILATLIPRPAPFLDNRANSEAQARVRSARANLAVSEAEVTRAESQLELAESKLERRRKLRAQNHIPPEELEEAQTEQRRQVAVLQAARDAVRVAQGELDLAKAALSSLGQGKNPRSIDIIAPIDGQIFRVIRESESVVAAGTRIMEVGNPERLEVVVDLLSQEAVKVKAGQSVDLQRWGGEKPIRGQVRLVEPSGFTKISALGVEEQRVNTIIDITDPDPNWKNLGDNFRVEVHIHVWEGQDILQMPQGALFRESGQWSVYTVSAGTATLTRVEIGRQNGRQAQILNGLAEGDQVILHPSDQIRDGTKVAK